MLKKIFKKIFDKQKPQRQQQSGLKKIRRFYLLKAQLQPLPRTGTATWGVRSQIDGASLTFFRFADRLEILLRFSDERIDGRNVAIRQNSDGSAGRKEPDERAEPAQVPGMRHAQN